MTFDPSQAGIDAREWGSLSAQQRRHRLLLDADLVRSSGPWLVLRTGELVFDAINAGDGIGYNASPLFGVLHHPVSWAPDWSDGDTAGIWSAINSNRLRAGESKSENQTTSNARDAIRSYIAANVLEQFSQHLNDHAETAREIILHEAKQLPGFDSAVTVEGQSIVVKFHEPTADPSWKLLAARILTTPIESGAVELKLPLNLCRTEMAGLIERVASVWQDASTDVDASRSAMGLKPWGRLRDHHKQYEFHAHLLAYKFAVANGTAPPIASELEFVHRLLPAGLSSAEVVFVTVENWSEYRNQVAEMQTHVYEPSRQTEIEKFDALVADEFGFGLLVIQDGEIAGMVFVGPLDLFPEERGTLDDPYRGNRHTMYTLDLTIANEFRGSLGRIMKQAITLMIVAAGHQAIHGRNRDRLAGGMWAINLGLGGYELKRLVDDYPDEQPFRDCIYYRCPLRWPKSIRLNQFDASQMADIIHH